MTAHDTYGRIVIRPGKVANKPLLEDKLKGKKKPDPSPGMTGSAKVRKRFVEEVGNRIVQQFRGRVKHPSACPGA